MCDILHVQPRDNAALLPTLVVMGAFLASMWLTNWYRHHARALLLLDVPNARSSHTRVTPRGGGVAIVLPMLVAVMVLGWARWLPLANALCLCGGGAMVALVGFIDDHRHVAPLWRLTAHFAAAFLVTLVFVGLPPLTLLGIPFEFGSSGFAVASIYLVWMLNLTNFMDGIDGIAGVETISVSLGAILLSCISVPGERLWVGPLLLASTTLGFLVWNWPPAKIFMGDVGSGFLGFTLGVLSLQAGWVASRLFWSWVILLGVFIVDATVTLIRRIARGERFDEAHRSHAYQHAARRWGSHKPVTVAVGVINICWLLPVAFFVARAWLDGVLGVVIAYAPLVAVAMRLEAGKSSAE